MPHSLLTLLFLSGLVSMLTDHISASSDKGDILNLLQQRFSALERRTVALERQLASSSEQNSHPVGTILPYVGEISAGASLPQDWLLCDGRALDKTDYPTLYAVISSKFNSQPNLVRE